MVEFISTYEGINYKIPESKKYARFTNGKFATNDSQVISYLHGHPDYGQTLTDTGKTSKKSITVDVAICPICGKVCGSKLGLNGHMRVHKELLPESRDESEDI